MKITLQKIPVADIYAGYYDDAENGVVGYAGRLDIRPPYQREFIYKDHQRDAVIETVLNGFPLNVLYWARKTTQDAGGRDLFEVMDGQQRTISLCQYIAGAFSIKGNGRDLPGDGPLYFQNLPDDRKRAILDYELSVYVCDGTDTEKLSWFKTINIAGERLTDQELRNAVYAGPWLSDAKPFFSKTNGPAYQIGNKYLKGVPNRQDYLETALDWISGGEIETYMAQHQHDPNAYALRSYFQSVITWVETLFGRHYRKEMKGVNWGSLYNAYHERPLDAEALEQDVLRLMRDDDVTHKSGIYPYLFNGNESALSIRSFTESQRRSLYERQEGFCPACLRDGVDQRYEFEAMQADHITPWSEGGHTTIENGQMLCKMHNRKKSDN